MAKNKHLFDRLSDEEFINLVQSSRSMSELVLKIGYASGEGTNSRKSVETHCIDLGVQPPKATGAIMTEAAVKKNTMSDEEYFRKGVCRTGRETRKRLCKYKILEYKCSVCGNTGYWNGQPITLEVDHINGDHLDNRIENLRFLCPNCHSQTETFRGKKHTKI